MAELSQILSIAPAALAAAGLMGGEGAGPTSGELGALSVPEREPWAWRLPHEARARIAGDTGLQDELTRAWGEAVTGAASVRLALHDVPPTHRRALVERLSTLRPAVGAVFVADVSLAPDPPWHRPLRVGAVGADPAGELFDGLRSDPRIADTYTPGEPDDLLVVSDATGLALLEQHRDGIRATCVLWCAPQPPRRAELARLDGAARGLGASGWIVADLSGTGAADWLRLLVRGLLDDRPLDEAAARAGSWLTVAHPGLVERRALSDALPYPAGPGGASEAVHQADNISPPSPPAPAERVTIRPGTRAGALRHLGSRFKRAVTPALRVPRRAGPAPGRPDARFLQALVAVRATGEPRRQAFLPGAVHDIHLRVGPGSPEWHAATEEFPEEGLSFRGTGARLVVEFYEERSTASRHTSKAIVLPDRGASSEAVFPVAVGPDEREIRCGARVYHRDRLLQRLELTGPVGAADRPVAGREITVHGEVFSSLSDNSDSTDSTDATDSTSTAGTAGTGDRRAAVIRIDSDDRADIRLNGTSTPVRLADLDRFRALIQQLLTDDLDRQLGAPETELPPPDALLRGLAQQGSTLFDQLATLGLGSLKDVTFLQVVSAEAAELWPVEFVYDYGYPRDGATLCAHWREALATGTCSCRRGAGSSDGTGRRTICPLGFWGLRMEIERRVERDRLTGTVVEPDATERGRALRPVDSVLFAASDKVRAQDRTATAALLRTSFGADGLHTAASWRAWRQVVRAQGPPLLVALPHNASDEGSTAVLEIGKTNRPSRLAAVLIDRRYILSDRHDGGTGPVVMLLGCTMAQAEVRWQNVAAKFLQESAPVVVATLVPTLGRQAAVMAGIGAATLADRASDGKSIGELVRDIRRLLLARGFTLAMSIVAFGDARWLVESPAGNTAISTTANADAAGTPVGGTP
ncbi:hypothetical protein [Kitasatospora sp. NPDC005748]|uniref:hypothetical protein n=1 Tax=Kitasatospora sp. NPDC005748 TaxID=3157063 RepID=UPI0033E22208